MVAALKLKGSYTVKPAEPTWEGRVALSELDQVGCITHIPAIAFYRPPRNLRNAPPETLTNTINDSLSRVLVPFYPLAGRLHWITEDRLELHCNVAGARFVETESESELNEIIGSGGGFFSPSPENRHLIPTVDYSLPIHELPLVLVQLTRFSCGGISISLCVSHAVVDGQSLIHFISEWTGIVRGDPLRVPPFLDRKLALRAGEPPAAPPSLDHSFDLPTLLRDKEEEEEKEDEEEEEINKKATTLAVLRLSKDQVETLRKTANEGGEGKIRPYTRYETLAAHVWRCACKARGLRPEQPTTLGVCVDTRRRVRPELPWGYFGNAIFDVLAGATAGEVVSRRLGFAAGKIREAVEKVTDEHVWSAIDYLKRHHDLTEFQDLGAILKGKRFPFYENPNLGVVSWLSLPMYGLDFGWGREVCVGPGDVEGESSYLLPCPSGDGSLILALCLQSVHMDAFKKHFYDDILDFNNGFRLRQSAL